MESNTFDLSYPRAPSAFLQLNTCTVTLSLCHPWNQSETWQNKETPGPYSKDYAQDLFQFIIVLAKPAAKYSEYLSFI